MASPPPPSPPPPPCEIVEMELAAAQALAHLADAAATESGAEGSSSSRKRIKSDPVEELIDINQNLETIKSSVKIPSSPSSSRSAKMKQNLTETEREERRLRRILANRESARQTIRRRQALREELTKRVVDLSMENENMKLEKDLAMKEYLSLKDANEKLKEQIARAMRFEDEKSPDVTTSKSESSSPLIAKLQLISYEKTPALSVMYPPLPFIPQDTIVFDEQGGGSSYISGSMTTHYMPCSWYYPLPHEVSGSTMYSESTQNKKDPATIVAAKDVSGSNRDEVALKPSPERPTSCHEISLCDDRDKDKDIAEELQGYCTLPPDKVSSSMTATTRTAADARKRRKEITKLKQLHGRHTG